MSSLALFRDLEPWLQPYATWLYNVGLSNGFRMVVTSVYRSNEAQAVLYERYKRGLSDLPAAPPGKSKHNHRLAWDMVVQGNYRGPEQAWLGALWKRMGGRWFASDPVHFEV